jgi:hypothetical protein
MKKTIWNKLDLQSSNFLIETEMEVEMAKQQMSVAEIPIPCMKRIGQSKWDLSWKTWIQIRKYLQGNEKYLKNLRISRFPNFESKIKHQQQKNPSDTSEAV